LDRVKIEIAETYLVFKAIAAIMGTLKSLNWNIINNDSINTGLNLFQLSRKANNLNKMNHQELYKMLYGGGLILRFTILSYY